MHVRATALLVILLLAVLALAYARPGVGLDVPEGYTLVTQADDAHVYRGAAGCLYVLWSSEQAVDLQAQAAGLDIAAPSCSLTLYDLLARLGLEQLTTHRALPPLKLATVDGHYPALVTPHRLYARDITFHLPGDETGRHGELFVFSTPSSRWRTVAVLYLTSRPDLAPDLELFKTLEGLHFRNIATPAPKPGIHLDHAVDVKFGRPSFLSGSHYVSFQMWSRGPNQLRYTMEPQTTAATRRTAHEISWLVTVQNRGTIAVSDVYLKFIGPIGLGEWFSDLPRLDLEPGAIAEFRLNTLVPRTPTGGREADHVVQQTHLELVYTAHGQEYRLPVE